jgi:hypothetical protein
MHPRMNGFMFFMIVSAHEEPYGTTTPSTRQTYHVSDDELLIKHAMDWKSRSFRDLDRPVLRSCNIQDSPQPLTQVPRQGQKKDCMKSCLPCF